METISLNTVVSNFNPYVNNQGTIVGISGPDFCLLAADTRLASDLSVPSRNIRRIFQVSRLGMIGSAGCHSDGYELNQLIRLRSKEYSRKLRRPLSPRSLAYMISNSLYSRRSFPFYSFCVVGGLEREGCGQLYKFDALGSMEQLSYTCAGAGEKILQSLLDCTVGDPRRVNGSGVERGKSISRPSDGDTTHKLWRYDRESNSFLSPEERHRTCFVNITASEACAIVADAFAAAAERDITIGDSVNIHLLRRSGKQGRIFSRLFRISLSPSGSRNNLNARMYPTEVGLDDSTVAEDAVTPGLAYSGNLYDPDEPYASTDLKHIDKNNPNARIYSDVIETPDRISTDEVLNGAEDNILASFRSARKAIYSSGGGNDGKKSNRDRSESLDEVIADHPYIQVDPLTGEPFGALIPCDAVSEYLEIFTLAKEMIALTLPSDRIVSRIENESKSGRFARGGCAQALVQGVRDVAASLQDEVKQLLNQMLPTRKRDRRPSIDVLLDNGLLLAPDKKFPGASHSLLERLNDGSSRADSPVSIAASLVSHNGIGSVSPRGKIQLAVYQYVPYKLCDKRVVTVIALKVLRALRAQDLIGQTEFGNAKDMVLSGRMCVPMAVERFARDPNSPELLVAQLLEVARRRV